MTDAAARNKRNRRAGSRWQGDVLRGARLQGFEVERLALAGKEDEGDHVISLPNGQRIVIEAKAGKLHLTEFLRQSQVEADNYARHRSMDSSRVHPVVFNKRAGKGFGEGVAILTINEYLRLVELAGTS